jgi:hypothetical protein
MPTPSEEVKNSEIPEQKEIITFRGKNVEDMTREEILDCVRYSAGAIKRLEESVSDWAKLSRL